MSQYDHDPVDALLRPFLRRLPPRPDCPPDARWLALVGGELAAEEAEQLRRHLGDCAACVSAAADAHRFLRAIDPARLGAQRLRFRRGAVAAVATAAAAAVMAVALGWLWKPGSQTPADPLAAFVAGLEPPTVPAAAVATAGDDLVYRGSGGPAALQSLDAALAPYRVGDFVAACSALADHGRRFPSDREARYLAAVSCLKAHELDRAEGLLASLAAVAGDRRDDARVLHERLRRARSSGPP